MEQRRRVAAHYYRRIRVCLLAETGDLQGPLTAGEPVEPDAECDRTFAAQEPSHVETGLLHHPGGEVDHLGVYPVSLEVLSQEREADGVHLEERARRD